MKCVTGRDDARSVSLTTLRVAAVRR